MQTFISSEQMITLLNGINLQVVYFFAVAVWAVGPTNIWVKTKQTIIKRQSEVLRPVGAIQRSSFSACASRGAQWGGSVSRQAQGDVACLFV